MSKQHADEEGRPEDGGDQLSAGDLREIAEGFSAHFPPPRVGTELVLLEVNPHRAHAYWNIDLEDYRAAQARAGSSHAPLVIRVFDVTDSTPPERAITAFDTEVQGLQGHLYLNLWKDGRIHLADLGLRDPDGRLIPLARSNTVSTPSAGESDVYSTKALDLATAEDQHATDLLASRATAPKAVTKVESLPMWPNAKTLEQLIPASPVDPAPENASEPAVAPLLPKASVPVNTAASPLSLDSYVSLSSFEPGRPVVALEVNVELHIYGRAKPGTELTLYGQPVPLRPDGTFSIRKPLPQGAIVLPLLAVESPPAES